MKYIKKFQNNTALETYKKSNFVAPHVYLDNNSNTVQYMEEYIPLEYISSTSSGGQYIDLGCHLMENTDDIQIDIKFNITGNGKNGGGNDPLLGTLIGSQPEVSPWPGFVLRINSSDIHNITLQAKWQYTNSTREASSNSKYHSKYLSYKINSNDWYYAYWQNTYEFTEILNNIPQSQVNDCTCTLFCALNSSNNPFRFVAADLYYLKFTKGGQVIRNLIPVRKLSTNEIGLYDMENDHFYTSQGDEPFVAGPIK